ncbi:hypothetical protein SeLEV6574_g06676 [Synchytrium endobioticum]|uniref:RING-type domain-containing protein n=1 Tax=Synchytrium endobioticum TaxID=286115 RepID=A0A507CML4_9FUNG|nr:hypothetical protein SeLEV6574_g06676 [Synchytrium endobioticum]
MSRRTVSVISSDSVLDSARAEPPELDMGAMDDCSQTSTSPSKSAFLRAFEVAAHAHHDHDHDHGHDTKPIIDLDAAILSKTHLPHAHPQRVFGSALPPTDPLSHTLTSPLLDTIPSSSPRKSPSKRAAYASGIGVRTTENMPPASTLGMLESRFHSFLISPPDLAFAPADILLNSADGMRQLEADLLQLIQSLVDTALRTKADSLLTSVLQEADILQSLPHFQSTSDILPSATRELFPTFSTDAQSTATTVPPLQFGPSSSSASQLKTRFPLRHQMPPRPASVATVSSSINYTDASFPTINSLSTSGLINTPPGPNDVFLWTPFAKIVDHLGSESTRASLGAPTVLAVAGWIIIGTNKSVILVYDLAQTRQYVLGLNQLVEYGPVTALSISSDQSLVAAGYDSGFIVLWDIQKRVASRVIPPLSQWDGRKDGHMLGAPVIQIGFVGGSKSELVSGDNQGAAFLHTLSRILLVNTVTSARIHGRPDALVKPIVPTTIYAMSPMPHARHALEQHGLVALSTPYKLAVLTVRPIPQILFKLSWAPEGELTKSASLAAKQAVPCACLAWSPLVTPSSHYRSSRPLTDVLHLAASSGFKLYIIKATSANEDDKASKESIIVPEFVVLAEWMSPENIVALQWLNPQLLLLMTNHQDLLVFDIATMQAVERSSVLPRQVVAQNLFSKALSIAEPAWFSSVRMFKGRVFMLCQGDLCMVQLVRWTDRLNSLARSGNFCDALALGCDFYSGTYRRAAGSIPTDDTERQLQVSTQVVNLLTTYVDMSLHSYDPLKEDPSLYKALATVCFKTCIAVFRQDFLLSDIYEKFSDVELEGVYFETLEEYAIREELTNISNPTVVSAFIAYYKKQGWFARAEQVILQLDPASIDVHGILTLCRSTGLYNAVIFIYNRALRDYVSPIVEILKLMATDDQIDIGKRLMNRSIHHDEVEELSEMKRCTESARRDSIYALYVYLAYILTGKAFPVGALPVKEALKAKTDVYNFLFSPYHAFWPPDGMSAETSLLRLGDPPFPYVRLLFRHDPKEFLKVIGQAFEDSSLEGEIPAKDMFGLNIPGGYHVRDEVSRQSVAETLLSIVENDVMTSYKVAVYAFLARACARYTTFLAFSDEILQKIVTELALYKDDDSRMERESAVMALMGRWKNTKVNQFVSIFEDAGFWRVCEAQYRQDEQYDKVVDCYLNDPIRTAETFICIQELLSDNSILYSYRETVRAKVMTSITRLVKIDAEMAAAIVAEFFSDAHTKVVLELNAASEELEWLYLKGLLEPQRVVAGRTNASAKLPSVIYRRYVELLCQKTPHLVLPYLVKVSDESEGYPYDLQKMFQVCHANKVVEAAVWILERSGDIRGALGLLLEGLKDAAEEAANKEIQAATYEIETEKYNSEHGFVSAIENVGGYKRSSVGSSIRDSSASPDRIPPGAPYTEDRRLRMEARKALSSAQDAVEASIELCRRASARLSKPKREELWFSLLDATVSAPHALLDKAISTEMKLVLSYKRMLESFKALCRAVMSGMIGQVALSSILQRLVTSQPDVPLGEHRALLDEMLEGHRHESETLRIAVCVGINDVDSLQRRVLALRIRGIRPARAVCGICRKLLGPSSNNGNGKHEPDDLLVYKCRHAYHNKCMQQVLPEDADHHDDNGFEIHCVMCKSPSGLIRKKRGLNDDQVRRNKGKGVAVMSLDNSKGKEKASAEVDPRLQDTQDIESKVEGMIRFVTLSRAITPTSELLHVLTPKTEEMDYDLDDETALFAAPPSATFGCNETYLEEDEMDYVAQTHKLPSVLSKTRPKHRLNLAPPQVLANGGVGGNRAAF